MFKNILNFEDNKRDFPYYKKNPHIPKGGWIILLLSVAFAYVLYMIVSQYSEFLGSIVFCMSMFIPLMHFSNWNYDLIFHKPNKDEIKLAVLLFIGYIVYTIILILILDNLGMTTSDSSSFVITYETLVSLVFSMMGEELLKFIPLMFFMRFFYKFSNNRNVSIAFASIIVLSFFALLHYDGSLMNVLIFQGLGSMFELAGYLKTKNLYVPYITHILTDAFLMSLAFLI